MSGFIGMVNFSGVPVDDRLLQRMTASLAFRGPDRQETWIDDGVGLGHALLDTTGFPDERQPSSLDGQAWIAADARVDGRSALVARLESRGRSACGEATDAQLILHAYHVWGDRCVEHLLGDFSFAIWDGPAQRLFCARDHFGIKPFYYARTHDGVVFSNTLDCIRMHPDIGSTLNELAIGDFLLFGYNEEPTTTTFADIRRVPPAHTLTYEGGTLRSERYWVLPTDGFIRYRKPEDYVTHFQEILRDAVSDRLRTNDAGVWMSGGLDSTSIAAIAMDVLNDRGTPYSLRAHTIVYDTLIPDRERPYAQIAAQSVGVDVNFFIADRYAPFEGWDRPSLRTPEPTDDVFLLMRREQLAQSAAHSRVMLCGEGGDEVFWPSYVVDLLGAGSLFELMAATVRSLAVHRRRPGIGLRSWLRTRFAPESRLPAYPPWLNAAFTDRMDLRARWARWHAPNLVRHHPLRSEAHRRLATAPWAWYFESFDPGVTGVPVEGRYPFLDLRVIDFLLAVPPLPWCVDKQLLRVAMRGVLADPVRLRRKTALAGDPLRAWLQKPGVAYLNQFEAAPELDRYVDRSAIAGGGESQDHALNARLLCLNHWLKRERAATQPGKEMCHDRQFERLQTG